MTAKYNERQGRGLRWHYILMDIESDTAADLSSEAVKAGIEFIYQRHHEEGRSMFRVLEGDLEDLTQLAKDKGLKIKEVW